jgi:hypothetical protein
MLRSGADLGRLTLWIFLEKKSFRGASARQLEAVSFRENSRDTKVPPPPLASERLDWREVCKNALQNLEPLRVRGQNLDDKGVRACSAVSTYTASALTMICSLDFRVKVGCHIGVWKTRD